MHDSFEHEIELDEQSAYDLAAETARFWSDLTMPKLAIPMVKIYCANGDCATVDFADSVDIQRYNPRS